MVNCHYHTSCLVIVLGLVRDSHYVDTAHIPLLFVPFLFLTFLCGYSVLTNLMLTLTSFFFRVTFQCKYRELSLCLSRYFSGAIGSLFTYLSAQQEFALR